VLKRFFRLLFISLNVITAILFLLAAFSKHFNPESWWVVGLFALGMPYLLLILIGFIFFWLFARPWLMLISVITIGIAIKQVENIIPFHLTTSFPAQKPEGTIRVMSWNVEHFDILEHKTRPGVKQQMLELINQYQPDIACFQEMVAGEDDHAINYVYDFLNDLQFAAFNYSYNVKLDFDKRHHFGIITFSKFPMINKKTVMSEPYTYNNIFQYSDVVINNDTVRIFNIHLQSLRFSADNLQYLDHPVLSSDSSLHESKSVLGKIRLGLKDRGIQAQRVRTEMDKSPYPIILCGDFNDVPNSFAYQTIGDSLDNAFVKKGRGIGKTFYSIAPTLRIDNIFVDRRFSVDAFLRINKKMSDHYPILTDITFKSARQ
jgi:endonuclease/exonuclease/phosphatase family metal-dependent hydrolase